jgi:hypothetical protein
VQFNASRVDIKFEKLQQLHDEYCYRTSNSVSKSHFKCPLDVLLDIGLRHTTI